MFRAAAVIIVAGALASCGGSAGVPTTTGSMPSGTEFTPSDRRYSLQIDGAWTKTTDEADPSIERWITGPALETGFAPNVSVFVQLTGGSSLDAYLSLAIIQEGDLILIDSRKIRGTNGNELGLFEYTNKIEGETFHFLSTMDVHNGEVIAATFVTADADFADERSAVEPYLRTLQATRLDVQVS